ncbi:MAG: histidine kinase [Blastocatellia bacterium]|nr:histidine kinase [Blastocatellia bacterium]
MKKNRHEIWLLNLGIWTLIGAFFTSQGYLFHTDISGANPFKLEQWLFRELTYCYLFALSTPLILWFVNRFKFDRRRIVQGLLIHIPASFVFSMTIKGIHAVLMNLFSTDPFLVGNNPMLDPGKPFSLWRLVKFSYYTLDTGALIYWVILLISHAIGYFTRFQQAESRAAQLEAKLAQAQLQALKMQLQPHFLFNTLNSISELLHEDADAAEKMLVRLGDFLRMTLHNSGNQEVPLQKELEFLKCYLEIEQVRFQDRLKIDFEVAPETLQAGVPNMILQPIVENAIRHGVTRCAKGGEIEIRTTTSNGRLSLSVEDNGPGLPDDEPSENSFTKGVGLSNSRARLEQLYGSKQKLELTRSRKGGLLVALELPFHEYQA